MFEVPPQPVRPEQEKRFEAAKSQLIRSLNERFHPMEFSEIQQKVLQMATPKNTFLRLVVNPQKLEQCKLMLRIGREIRTACRDVCVSGNTRTKVSISIDSECVACLIDKLDALDRRAIGDGLVQWEWAFQVEPGIMFGYHMEEMADDITRDLEGGVDWRSDEFRRQQEEEFYRDFEFRLQDFRQRLKELHAHILEGRISAAF